MAQRCLSCMQMTEGSNCPHCGWPGKTGTESHQLAVGTMLRRRYQIGKVLGQGGFGITYLGWDTLMLQTVAIKEFYPSGSVFRRTAVSAQVECATDAMIPHYEYTRERFLREAQALVRFREIPEVVDILDFIEENNTAYIVMEYVRGVDLAKYIAMKGGRLSVEETFRILKPVIEALAKVHKGGIVHRDISPDNIILDPMGGAKLLDFGAVRAVEDPEVDKGLNKSTEAILKQGFAPIEQYNTRGSLGPWTDEYAMCATVWYCLTGRVPEEASIRMSEGIDPDWSGIEGLPEHQRRALQKGFSCRARDRYKSMDELLADLFPEAEQAPPAELPKAEIPKEAEAPEKAEKQPKAHRSGGKKSALIFTAVVAVIVLVLLAAVFFIPGKQEASPSQLQEAPGTLPSEAPGQTPPTAPSIPETVPPTDPLSEEERNYLQAEQLLAEGRLGEAAIAFGKLAGFSDARERSFEIWERIAARDTIGAGLSHTVGLKTDGTVIALGSDLYEQCDVSGWTDIVAVSTGSWHTVGLKADGTVVAVGDNESGKCDVENWTDIVAISAGGDHTVGLRANGTVVAVGDDRARECDVENWTDIVAVSAGSAHTVGLKADGTVVAMGSNSYGQCAVSKWSDIVAVSAGYWHTVGLRADGTVVAVGQNDFGQRDVTEWTDIVAISTDSWLTVGLRADGSAVAVGRNDDGQCDVGGWTDIVAVSAGYWHTVGLRADGTVVAVGSNHDGQCGMAHWSPWTDIRIPGKPVPFR